VSPRGFLHLSVVLAAFSRRVVGWSMAGHLRTQLFDRTSFRTRADARLAVFVDIEAFCNARRRHSALGCLSPAEFERRHRHGTTAATERSTVHGSGATPRQPEGRSPLDPARTAHSLEVSSTRSSSRKEVVVGSVEIGRFARVAVGVTAVVVQIALAFFYIGWAMFVAPLSSIIVLACIWVAGVVAVVWLALRDAWLAPLIPVAWFITVLLMFEYGTANLGWGA
jgi:hypothetical protein